MIKEGRSRRTPANDPASNRPARRTALAALGRAGVSLMIVWTTSAAAPALAQTAAKAAGSAGATATPPVLLVLGDSLSAEYGITRGTGWVPLLDKRLKERKIDYRVVNASISGDTTSGGVSRLPALLTQHKPKIVIVELGSNDALRGLALNMTETNLRKIVSSAQQAGAKVLVVGMQIPPNYGRDYTQRFQQLFGKVATEQKAALVPFLLEGIADKPELFQADRLHPVSAAQPTLLDNVWPSLEPLLRQR